jgi:hypothetical protein
MAELYRFPLALFTLLLLAVGQGQAEEEPKVALGSPFRSYALRHHLLASRWRRFDSWP